jgi:hypothetical protein
MDKSTITESVMWGFRRTDFTVDGRKGFVTMPAKPVRPTSVPWVWYAPTFVEGDLILPKELHAWYMKQWLEAGIGIAGIDVGEAWGSPAGRKGFTSFHTEAVKRFSLDTKSILLGQSRGGPFVYNWAAEHADCVRAIVGIYAVCDVTAASMIERVSAAYGMSQDDLRANAGKHNPIDRLSPIAAAKIPLFNVHGDKDAIVPLPLHPQKLVDKYRALGGPVELLVLPGEGHEEVDAFFKCPAVLEFVLKQAQVPA